MIPARNTLRRRRDSAAATDDGYTRSFRKVLGEARDIRIDVQDLLATLDQIDTAAAISDESLRTPALAEAIHSANQRLGHSAPDIDQRLAAIYSELDTHPDLNDELSDQFEQIGNKWERVNDGWIGGKNALPANAMSISLKVRPFFNDIMYLIAQVTIPPRLEQHLRHKHLGETLVFKDEFEEELPDETMRIRMLTYLQNHSKIVAGQVNVPEQTILRTSDSFMHGGLALFLGLLLGIIPFGIIALDRFFEGFDNTFFKEDEVNDFAKLYAWVLIGASAHFIIALVKSGQSGESLILARQIGWLSTKQGPIVVAVLSLWIISYGAWRGFGGEFDRDTAFFAGYSFDSFIDIILTRFDTSVNTATDKIRKRLAPAPA